MDVHLQYNRFLKERELQRNLQFYVVGLLLVVVLVKTSENYFVFIVALSNK